MKLDKPERVAWLRLYNRFLPDIFSSEKFFVAVELDELISECWRKGFPYLVQSAMLEAEDEARTRVASGEDAEYQEPFLPRPTVPQITRTTLSPLGCQVMASTLNVTTSRRLFS